MSSIIDTWVSFFRNSGVPKDVHKRYAQRFVKERIQPSMLKDIGKSELIDLGVTTLGDQLCILRYIKSSDGILDEFKAANKQRIMSRDEDDISMISNDSDSEEVRRSVKIQQPSIQRKAVASRVEVSLLSTLPSRIGESVVAGVGGGSASGLSRVIRKKPVMIHDVSSSSSRAPALGRMRSDDISTKTMIVAGDSPPKRVPLRTSHVMSSNVVRNQLTRATSAAAASRAADPDFRVRLDVRPQVAYDNMFANGEDDMDLELDVPLPRARNSGGVPFPRSRRQQIVSNAFNIRHVGGAVRPTLTTNALAAEGARSIASRVTLATRRKPEITVGRAMRLATKTSARVRAKPGILSRVSVVSK